MNEIYIRLLQPVYGLLHEAQHSNASRNDRFFPSGSVLPSDENESKNILNNGPIVRTYATESPVRS